MKRILVIQGHPHPADAHFCHALAFEYAHCAEEAGHEVRTLAVARMEFPLLRDAAADLEAVPADGVAMISVRVGDLLNHAAFKGAREKLAKDARERNALLARASWCIKEYRRSPTTSHDEMIEMVQIGRAHV